MPRGARPDGGAGSGHEGFPGSRVVRAPHRCRGHHAERAWPRGCVAGRVAGAVFGAGRTVRWGVWSTAVRARRDLARPRSLRTPLAECEVEAFGAKWAGERRRARLLARRSVRGCSWARRWAWGRAWWPPWAGRRRWARGRAWRCLWKRLWARRRLWAGRWRWALRPRWGRVWKPGHECELRCKEANRPLRVKAARHAAAPKSPGVCRDLP
jgi:hypothetical protein